MKVFASVTLIAVALGVAACSLPSRMCSGHPPLTDREALDRAVHAFRTYLENRYGLSRDAAFKIDAECCARTSEKSVLAEYTTLDHPDAFQIDVANFTHGTIRVPFGASYYISSCGKITEYFIFDHDARNRQGTDTNRGRALQPVLTAPDKKPLPGPAQI